MKDEVELNWEITRCCNFNCKHCLTTSRNNKQDFLTLQRFKIFVEPLAKNYKLKIKFTGGEPFAKKDFLEYVKFCLQNKVGVEIITNASLLTDDIIETLCKNNICLGISLESFDKTIFESIRGEGTFNRVYSNLIKVKNAGIDCKIYCTLSAKNYTDIKNIISICNNLGFSLHFNELTIEGNATINQKELTCNTNLLNEVQNVLKALRLEKLYCLDTCCWASGDVYYINYLGNIYFCTEIGRVESNLKLGNVNDFPFIDWLQKFKTNSLIKYGFNCPYGAWCNNFITYVTNEKRPCCFETDQPKIKNIEEFKTAIAQVLKDCGKFCKGCKFPDCMGFIWLLKEEIKTMLKNNVDILQINKDNYFISMLKDDQQPTSCLDVEKPKCLLRDANGMCSIHNIKPLVCTLYPISMFRSSQGNLFWILHYDCAFIRHLIKEEALLSFVLNFYKILGRTNKKLIQNIARAFIGMDNVTSYLNEQNKIIIIKEVEYV